MLIVSIASVLMICRVVVIIDRLFNNVIYNMLIGMCGAGYCILAKTIFVVIVAGSAFAITAVYYKRTQTGAYVIGEHAPTSKHKCAQMGRP